MDFNYDGLEAELENYFETAETIVQEKYKKSFNKTSIIRVLRGVRLGIMGIMKRRGFIK